METPHPTPSQFDDTVLLSAMMRRCVDAIKSDAEAQGVTLSDQQVVTYGLVLAINLEAGMELHEAMQRARLAARQDPGYVDDYVNQNGL